MMVAQRIERNETGRGAENGNENETETRYKKQW